MLHLIAVMALGQMTVLDEGSKKGTSSIVNCSGAGVTCTMEAGRWVLSVSGGGAGSVGPYCSSGFVTASDGGSWYCTNGIAKATTATALATNPTDCSASQYATTIDTGGNLTCAQVSYSQLSGSPTAGGSPPQVQYNNSGVLGGVSTHTSDGTHVIQATEPTIAPTPTGGDTLVMLAPDAGFLGIPAYVDAAMNQVLPYGVGVGQMLWFQGQQSTWSCHYYALDQFGLSNLQTGGGTNLSVIGTSAATSWDAGSLYGRSRRVINNSTAAVNSGAGFQSTGSYVWRGNVSNAGGFYAKTRVWLKTWPGSRVIIGYTSSTSAPGAVEPSTTNDTAYIGADGTDTNLKACSKDEDAGPAADCLDLGGNFPKNGAGYDITFEAPPNSSVIVYHVVRLDSVVPDAVGVMRRLPVSSAFLAFHEWVQNTDAGQAVTLESAGFYECGNW